MDRRVVAMGVVIVVLAIALVASMTQRAQEVVTTTVTQTLTTETTVTETVTERGATVTVTSVQTVTEAVTETVTATVTAAPPQVEPALIKIAETEIMVNGSKGATAYLGPIIVVIRPDTYVSDGEEIQDAYRFSIVLYSVDGVGPSPDGEEPVFAFAFAVNGEVTPKYTFVDEQGNPKPLITMIFAPTRWRSWTWLGFRDEGDRLVGGDYRFPNMYHVAGANTLVNTQFIKPVPWIVVDTGSPRDVQVERRSLSVMGTADGPALVPIAEASAMVNASMGAAVMLGDIVAIVTPGTYVTDGEAMLDTYNFSVVRYLVSTVPGPNEDELPVYAFAFAVNGEVTPKYTFVDEQGNPKPLITIILDDEAYASWTWLGYEDMGGILANGEYRFRNVWLPGDWYIVNTQFIKPVPWVVTAKFMTAQREEVAELTMEMQDFRFVPDTITVRPGQRVRLTLVNDGYYRHSFVFEAANVETRLLSPGERITVEFTAPSEPGEYMFYCRPHRGLGMVGKVVVTP